MLSRSFLLMTDFLELFLLVFGQKIHKLKKILNNFLLQNRFSSLKNSKNYSFEYNRYKAYD